MTTDLRCIKPKRVAHARARKQDDEMAIFNVMTARYVVLNESAAHLWEHCDGETTIEAMARVLADKYPENPGFDQVVADVIETVKGLADKELVTWEEQADG